MLCHYQPYWNKKPGQFGRTQQYKLYRDGSFFKIPNDLKEKNNLAQTKLNPNAQQAREDLQAILEQCPPAPIEKAGKNSTDRPIYPKWKKLP